MYRMLVIACFSVITATACSTAQVSQVQPIDGVISGQCHTDMVRGNDQPDSAASIQTQASTGGDRLTIEIGRTNNITALRCG